MAHRKPSASKLKSTIDIPTIDEATNTYDTGGGNDRVNETKKALDTNPEVVLSQDDEQGAAVENESSLTLSLELLKAEILRYVDNHPSMDVMAKNTLKSDFELREHAIEFMLANPLEKEKVETEKGALLQHLRTSFATADLSISYHVNVAKGSSRPYTPKEKFDAMIAKNPQLGKLKEKLGLDTDY
jgi:hypothetical protein